MTLEKDMKTIRQAHSKDAGYWGGNDDWLIVATRNRDSDDLTESNFETMQATLNELSAVKEWAGEFTPVTIERSSHWAVGWVEYLIVDPMCLEAVQCANEMRDRLENYPILDEGDLSRRESEHADTIWKTCYSVKERVKYVRQHRSQFDFRGFDDMLAVIRGRYFIGYANELIR